jgi:hypothetical protein
LAELSTCFGILQYAAVDDEDDDIDPPRQFWSECALTQSSSPLFLIHHPVLIVAMNKSSQIKPRPRLQPTKQKAHVTNPSCKTMMMKAFPQQMLLLATTALLLMASRPTAGFLAPSATTRTTTTTLSAYVPDGLTASQYQKIKAQDRQKLEGKDLARLGPRGFKSRSMQAWQEAYEKGQAKHAYAPFGYREQLQKGQLKLKDVPYMVRPNGSWDNSDVTGAKRAKWTNRDREYANGGYKKEQSASILGSGPGFDWTGTRSRDENLRNKFVPGLS